MKWLIKYFLFFFKWRLKKYKKSKYFEKLSKNIHKFNREITITSALSFNNNFFLKYFLNINYKIFEIAFRQKLLKIYAPPLGSIFIYLNLFTKIPLMLPFPRRWNRLLNKNRKLINHNIIFSFFINFMYGLFFQIYSFFLFVDFVISKKHNYKNYLYIFDPSINSVRNTNNTSFSLINWIAKKYNLVENILHPHLCVPAFNLSNHNIIPLHRSKIIYTKLSFFNYFYLFIYFLFINLFSFVYLCFGKWAFSFMIWDIFLHQLVISTKSNNLANFYFFSNSSYIYKPLWTYAAESKKSKVIMYSYSLGFNQFLYNGQYLPQAIGFESMTWKKILVWSDEFIDFHKKYFKNNPYKKVEYIYDTDSFNKIPKFKRSIAVFDVSPVRFLFSRLIFPHPYYRNYKNCINFLESIFIICEKYKINILWKTKRSLNFIHDKKYKKFIDESSKKYKFLHLIDSSTSPLRLCNSVSAVISAPFTSTAYIGKVCNKPSIYFDPSNLLSVNDKGSMGIKLLTNKILLEKWIVKNVS